MSTTDTLWLFQYSQVNRCHREIQELSQSINTVIIQRLHHNNWSSVNFCRQRQKNYVSIFLSPKSNTIWFFPLTNYIRKVQFSYIVPTQSNNKWNLTVLIRRFDLTPEDPREAYKTIICHTIWLCWIYQIYVANL